MGHNSRVHDSAATTRPGRNGAHGQILDDGSRKPGGTANRRPCTDTAPLNVLPTNAMSPSHANPRAEHCTCWVFLLRCLTFCFVSAAGAAGLKSFRFSSLGRAARVGDAPGTARQPDDTADERHGLLADGLTTSAVAEGTAAPNSALHGSADDEADLDAGRKRKAEGQGVLSPMPAGLQSAAATAVLVKRRASPTLPTADLLEGCAGKVVAVDSVHRPVLAGAPEQQPKASAAAAGQHASGTGMGPLSNEAQHTDGGGCPGKDSAAKALAGHAEDSGGDEDDDDTVLPGNSRLAARVLAGRQSLAPSRAQVSANAPDQKNSPPL